MSLEKFNSYCTLSNPITDHISILSVASATLIVITILISLNFQHVNCMC